MLERLQLDTLVAAACAVRQVAYAPYSQFQVGAAVLAEDGGLYTGCNIENASFGLTICAERVAAAAAVANGVRRITAVVVAARPPASPCGACRQFLSEFGPAMAVVSVDGDSGAVWRSWRLDELLPDGFMFDHPPPTKAPR